MRQAIDDALHLAFQNEMPASLAPLAATIGRMRLRLAAGELVNWLRSRGRGHGRETMRLDATPPHRALRRIVRGSPHFRELFQVKGNYLGFRPDVSIEEQAEILQHVESSSAFPEDILIRR
ncbi:MAG: hypothetical protein WBD40_22205 [Tepidisphaeraceae bacterium]